MYFRQSCLDDVQFVLSRLDPYKEVFRASTLCENDDYFYQACGFGTKVTTNTDVLCGAYFCDQGHELQQCDENCQDEKLKCGTAESITTSSSTSGTTTVTMPGTVPFAYLRKFESEVYFCNHKCDLQFCNDEYYCNGYHYGLWCPLDTRRTDNDYVPVQEVCDGIKTYICFEDNGKDEENCTSFPKDLITCVHYAGKILQNQEIIVPIFFPPNAFLRRSRRKKALLRVNDRGGGWRTCILAGNCDFFIWINHR